MTGLVTDSNSQLPPDLALHHGVTVVPLTVTVDGVAYLEGEELDADDFYARFENAEPAVATSQPSPGRLGRAYRELAERGAREILSVHVGSDVSGTVNAARLAAKASPVPVRVVDSGTASFGVAWCVLEAAEALDAGASAQEAAAAAERTGGAMGNVFVVKALDLARAGGRLRSPAPGAGGGGSIPVLSLRDGFMEVVGRAGEVDEAAELMASWVRAAVPKASTGRLRVGIGLADGGATPLRDALEQHLLGAPEVGQVIRYRIGPSVGAHTGPGTVGAMFYPCPSSAG